MRMTLPLTHPTWLRADSCAKRVGNGFIEW